MENNIIPLALENIQDDIYAGFDLRLKSTLIDAAINLPVIFVILYINSISLNFYFFTTIPSLMFFVWYRVYLPKKYGGTFGKLIIGLKIIRIDGKPIDWKEAFLRESIHLALTILYILTQIYSKLQANEVVWNGLSWSKQLIYLKSFHPMLSKIQTWFSNIWFIGEIVAFIKSPRNRTLHDYIAGTVVVKAMYVDEIKKLMNPGIIH